MSNFLTTDPLDLAIVDGDADWELPNLIGAVTYPLSCFGTTKRVSMETSYFAIYSSSETTKYLVVDAYAPFEAVLADTLADAELLRNTLDMMRILN